jgi:hypothetical protein
MEIMRTVLKAILKRAAQSSAVPALAQSNSGACGRAISARAQTALQAAV